MLEKIIYNPTTNEMQDVTTFLNKEPQVEVSEDLLGDLRDIPKKMYFKIGEAADLLGVKPHVLRYWETEFQALKPQKSQHSQRIYSRQNIEMAMMIKKLLYKDRFSIEGARTALKKFKKDAKAISETRKEKLRSFQNVKQKTKALIEAIRTIKAKKL